jgi:hypothetical protein
MAVTTGPQPSKRPQFAVLKAWLEFPLLHGLDGLFVQSQAVQNPNIDGFSGRVNLDVKKNRALKLGLAAFLPILGLDFINNRGRRDAIAAAVNPAAESTAGTCRWRGSAPR